MCYKVLARTENIGMGFIFKYENDQEYTLKLSLNYLNLKKKAIKIMTRPHNLIQRPLFQLHGDPQKYTRPVGIFRRILEKHNI